MTKFQVGDKVQLSAAYLKLPISRYDDRSHFEDFKANAGTGTVTGAHRNGISVEWENGHASGYLAYRYVKRAK